jgi:hypothetical protein
MKSILIFQKWTKKMSNFKKPGYFMEFGIPPYDN